MNKKLLFALALTTSVAGVGLIACGSGDVENPGSFDDILLENVSEKLTPIVDEAMEACAKNPEACKSGETSDKPKSSSSEEQPENPKSSTSVEPASSSAGELPPVAESSSSSVDIPPTPGLSSSSVEIPPVTYSSSSTAVVPPVVSSSSVTIQSSSSTAPIVSSSSAAPTPESSSSVAVIDPSEWEGTTEDITLSYNSSPATLNSGIIYNITYSDSRGGLICKGTGTVTCKGLAPVTVSTWDSKIGDFADCATVKVSESVTCSNGW